MPDIFIEYLVKRKDTPGTLLLRAGIIVATLLAAFILLMLAGWLGSLSMLGTLAALGALYGGYYLFTAQSVEFEYAVTNGELDVDRITARRKRRRVVSVNLREAEGFGRYKAAEHAHRDYQTKIFACDSPGSEDLWYLVVRLKESGSTLIVFNSSEKMLNGMKPFLPRHIMHDAFEAGRS